MPTSTSTTGAVPTGIPSTSSSSSHGQTSICSRNSCPGNHWCTEATLQSEWYQSLATWCPKQGVDRCPSPHCIVTRFPGLTAEVNVRADEPAPDSEALPALAATSSHQFLQAQPRKIRPRVFLGREHMMIQAAMWKKGGQPSSTCGRLPDVSSDEIAATEPLGN
jgi:hypothetical protein